MKRFVGADIVSIVTPNKKISVLLIGNHSAGKSSLVNWNNKDDVQRTGVAIETRGKPTRIDPNPDV
jgi:predicted GTPase